MYGVRYKQTANYEGLELTCGPGLQVADFGSARSAKSEGYHWAEQGAPEVLRSSTYIVPASSQVGITFLAQVAVGESVPGQSPIDHGAARPMRVLQTPAQIIESQGLRVPIAFLHIALRAPSPSGIRSVGLKGHLLGS